MGRKAVTAKSIGAVIHQNAILIEAGKIDTTPLITHRYKLQDIEEAYYVFENKLDGVIKIAVEPCES